MPVHSYEADAQFPATEAAPLDDVPTSPAAPVEERHPRGPEATIATFMYARLHNFGAACHCMSGQELTAFVNDVRRCLSSSALKLGGEVAQRRPDSVLLVFSNRPDDALPDHAKRALHAAILTVHDTVLLASRLAATVPGLPPLSMAIGVHLGAGEVTPRTGKNQSQGTVQAVGEAVEIARLLEVAAADLQWNIVASGPTRQAAGSRVDSGRAASMGLPDDTFLDVIEITGLVPRPGSTTPASHYEALRNSLKRNQQMARSAVGQAMGTTAAPLNAGGHLLIEGYRLLRKLGEGGIASIFLAQPVAGGPQQVLKVLRLDNPEGMMGLQRFMQEFALLAQIDHPNVAHIFRQDFTAGNAYIAMEYFPQGDLRARMKRALDPGIALYYIRQIAAGLEAIHQVGIVHRDLKPDNVMVRADGMVALADFGIAKQVEMCITDTGAGEIVGTPYYLSPEQAMGRPVDARCDLYSLGVMAYEMLAGSKPFYAGTAQELLQMHVDAPVPRLPAALAHFQPVIDRMMAKDPAQRQASATALLQELESL